MSVPFLTETKIGATYVRNNRYYLLRKCKTTWFYKTDILYLHDAHRLLTNPSSLFFISLNLSLFWPIISMSSCSQDNLNSKTHRKKSKLK